MPGPPGRPRFTFTFEALADKVPAWSRVRRLLKVALRAFRLKCVRIDELPADSPRAEPDQDGGDDA